jgi:hypothetical protein
MPVLVPVPSTTSFPCVRAVTVAVGVAVAGNKNSGVLLQVRQVPELVQIGMSQQLLLQAIFALRRCPCLALAALLCRHDETTARRRKRTDEKHAFPKRTPSALSSRGGTHIFNFIAFEIYYNRQTLQSMNQPRLLSMNARARQERPPYASAALCCGPARGLSGMLSKHAYRWTPFASRWEHAGGDGGISGIGEVAVVGASRGAGLQCVLYLALKKMACRAIARDPAVHS